MGRTFIFMILAFGFFTSLLTRCASHTQARSNDREFSQQTQVVRVANSWSDAHPRGTTTTTSDGSVELQRENDGHFYADVQINGSNIRALVDTGATEIALSRADATSAGIATSIGMPEVIGQGADGDVHGEVVKIDRISLGNKEASDMPAVVLSAGGETLLGQRFLAKFDSVEIHGDTMVLK